jgi:hypothetical protein
MAVLVFRVGEGGGHAEADLSAEETEAEANARFPGASINQERTEDPEAAPKERAQAAKRGETASEKAKLEGRLATGS